MEIKILEDNRTLIKKGNHYYLVEKHIIRGTFCECYAIYQDIYYFNDLEGFIGADSDDNYCLSSDFTNLEKAIKYIQDYEG